MQTTPLPSLLAAVDYSSDTCHEMPRLPQSAAPATKNVTHVVKTSQKYCACHEKRLSTRCQKRPHVTKCHACHAKRRLQTRQMSKKDDSCETSWRHSELSLRSNGRLRTVASGCVRLTAHPEHSQKRNTTHMQASKRAFRARLPRSFTR